MHGMSGLRIVLLAGFALVFAPARGASPRAGYADLYARVAPAIVGITCVAPAPTGRDGGYFGTGAAIDGDGRILTSTTVIPPKARDIRFFTSDGRVLPGKLLGTDPSHELSVAQAEGWSPRPFVPLGESAGIEVGQVIFTFGDAFRSIETDGHVSLGVGVVSGIYTLSSARLTEYQATYAGPVIETDAGINPGMDGGPLVDAEGRIVGLLSLNYSSSRWLGTAVPVDRIKGRIAAIREGRWVESPKVPGTAAFGAAIDETEEGPVIGAVEEGGPASRAGLRPGDRIVSIGGESATGSTEIARRLTGATAGDRWVLEILRDGRTFEVIVELGGRL
ncbi:MAG: serine protease [Planctomycetes bacterium]|nr:serine protease [Planctomycetota bacterium]